MAKSIKPDPDTLRRLYESEYPSISQLAAHLGTSRGTVSKWLAEYNIPPKSHSQLRAQQKMPRKISTLAQERLEDRDWLYEHRVVQKLSIKDIGALVGVASETIVKKALEKHGVNAIDARRRNTTAVRCLEDHQWMYEKYVTDRMTMQDIADLLDTTKATVQRFIVFHGIESRDPNSYTRINAPVTAPVQEIITRIQSYYSGEIITNERTICKGLELDVYIPEKNLAIEYHGIYHHLHRPNADTFSLKKGPRYHITKTEYCDKQGIQLLQFFSDEYRSFPEKIHGFIRNRLGGFDRKIMARKCEVREVSTGEKNAFLNRYHIQGEDRSRYKIGLFYEDDMVALMTISASRFSSHPWEITRFCVKGGCVVSGGFSKLLAAFMERESGSIVSYADRRYSNGAVYRKNGFSLERVNRPSYYYVKNGTEVRINRMHLQKPPGIVESELEWATGLGYSRIYDCGTLTFVLHR